MTEQTAVPDVAHPPAKALVVQVVQISNVGLVRTENQDFAILSSPERDLSTEGRGRLMVVADGMGGHRGGATASRLAGTTIRDAFMQTESPDVADSLRGAMERANAIIFQESQSNAELRGMGTTCSALVIRGAHGYIGHVGDSRIYRVREGAIEQLTEDHSLVATMVKEGLLTSQEAEVHPRRNVLQRSMGVADEIEVDINGPFEVLPDDTFILCSDGLHGLVKEPEILEIARLPLEEAAGEYVKRAIERGAPDNVTVIVARAAEPSGKPATPPDPVTAPADDRKSPATPAAPRARSGMRKWLLVVFVLLAVGGAIAYWAYANQTFRP